MIITKIISNGKREFLIEFNDHPEIILTENVFVRHNLYKGREITVDEIEHLRRESLVQEAIELSIRKLRNRKTEFEIRSFLKDEGFPEPVMDGAIHYLYKYNLLDDQEYAILFARDKTNINQYGQIKISYLLRQKGVRDHTIQVALDEVLDRQFDIAWKLYEKRRHRYDLSKFKDQGKLANYLSGRGFTYDIIKSVIKRGQEE